MIAAPLTRPLSVRLCKATWLWTPNTSRPGWIDHQRRRMATATALNLRDSALDGLTNTRAQTGSDLDDSRHH